MLEVLDAVLLPFELAAAHHVRPPLGCAEGSLASARLGVGREHGATTTLVLVIVISTVLTLLARR
jgi:hypothetical protein